MIPTNKDYVLTFEELGITPELVISFMGYQDGETPEPILSLVNELISQASAHCDIRGGFVHLDQVRVDKVRQVAIAPTLEFETGKTITTMLRKCSSAFVFLSTAGPGLEKWARKLSDEGDALSGYIVDVIGSEVVELAMEKIHDDISAIASAHGFGVTNRYSPGYCEWKVDEQVKIFSLFPKDYCRIKLNDSCLMTPMKSVSGIIGAGKEAKRKGYTCDICNMKDCHYRQAKK